MNLFLLIVLLAGILGGVLIDIHLWWISTSVMFLFAYRQFQGHSIAPTEEWTIKCSLCKRVVEKERKHCPYCDTELHI